MKKLLLFSVFISFFFQSFYIDIGYAIKAFMVLIPLLYFFTSFGKFNIKFYNHEVLLFFTIIIFSSSLIYSYDYLSSFKMIVGLLILILLFNLLLTSITSFNPSVFFKYIYLSGLFFNIISLLLYFYGIIMVKGLFAFETQGVHYGLLVDRGIPRLIGTLKDPNFFIAFNSIFLFLSYYNFKESKTAKLLFILSSVTCLSTFSIGGFIAIICGFITMSLQNKKGIFRFLSLILLILCIYFISIWLYPEINKFIMSRLSGASDGSGRFNDWKNALITFLNYPFGIGIYSFLAYNQEILGGIHYVHNTYLEVLVEGGIHTFSFYILFIIVLLLTVYKLGKKNEYFEFLLPSTITLLMSFFSLSGFASEFWLFYLAIVHFCCNKASNDNKLSQKN